MKQQGNGRLDNSSHDRRNPPPLPAIIVMEKHRRAALSASQTPHATHKPRIELERGASETSCAHWFDDLKDPEDAKLDPEKYSHEEEPKKRSKTVDSNTSKTWWIRDSLAHDRSATGFHQKNRRREIYHVYSDQTTGVEIEIVEEHKMYKAYIPSLSIKKCLPLWDYKYIDMDVFIVRTMQMTAERPVNVIN
ncbi:hypothetical protein M438DRAFT_346500 [Aureobasidium pullulans EXF-150]|uniref:Uncharacterized protein n=1 Tax=Aureobasidium pullulans EXF-150 TaxID=1043002 RepID=A0A074Y9M7_AURPU|nr:uncharacterized protein M438DRAFT_346500 [Aureobasidium pullulans EXF-150]KEQ83556.1 hypothetical protein M438DRAFT_346500 [Aureobasidium pullulans EXF-150]